MRTALLAACFAALAVFASVANTQAAGALATGRCGAYGYSSDDVSAEAAAQRARAQCKGKDCRVVTSFAKTCAAFAIDAKNTCGPSGWAKAASLAHAQNVAAEQCHRFGGKTCVIRAWVCDSRG
jgi:hypothetical protein